MVLNAVPISISFRTFLFKMAHIDDFLALNIVKIRISASSKLKTRNFAESVGTK